MRIVTPRENPRLWLRIIQLPWLLVAVLIPFVALFTGNYILYMMASSYVAARDTVYADGFSLTRFARIRSGMESSSVLTHLGPPLNVWARCQIHGAGTSASVSEDGRITFAEVSSQYSCVVPPPRDLHDGHLPESGRHCHWNEFWVFSKSRQGLGNNYFHFSVTIDTNPAVVLRSEFHLYLD